MAYFDWGNRPISSTQAPTANPTTSALLFEIDSTMLAPMSGGSVATAGRSGLGRVTLVLGADTLANFRVERCLSTGLGATAIRELVPIYTPINQSGQYVMTMEFEAGDRLRCRVASSFTGTVNAYASVEPLT